MKQWIERLKQWIERLKQTKPLRVWDQFSAARGNLLAGGIAYVALFSFFALLVIGFTAFGLVLGGNTELKQQVVDYVNETFGQEIIGMNRGEGQVWINDLVRRNVLTTTGAIAVGLLLLTGLGWVDAMRQGIRAVFGLDRLPGPLLKKLLDIGVLAVLGLLVLASIAVSVGLSSASGWVLDQLGIASTPARVLVQVLVQVGVLGVDVVLFLTFFRLLARIPVSVRVLLSGAIIGAVGLEALKLSGGLLTRQASGNPLLASATTLAVLLLFFNLAGRITLLAAAWAAVTAADLGIAAEDTAGDGDDAAHAAIGARPAGARAAAAGQPSYQARAADRVTLAAGVILGGVTVAGMGLAGRVVRTARDALRRSA